ncbi:endonuclease domain-containing protein [Rufibacter roseus]|uniref:Endonuclease domain-containing protein n=1 Tax=Rufibacter roseus TaxID=1567108 RepID=A0ABW2DJD4_9BACT|nr:DUF559 domain-containing protein [Rufibacter roseus]
MPSNQHYNKKLKPFAKANRADSTKAEVRLWCELLSKRQMGVPFLRQRPIGNYIADFLCKELKLIIEVDGYSHQFKTEEDAKRDKALAELGYTTLRFTDEEAMNDLPNVQRTIEAFIEERKNTHS